ncbi:MAG: nicotinamide mononucleotide transporter [Lachnospiraceae bacterium]|nr:nicotinamide mononucleotide transporter [Lachnospiraceae bacterium]
MKLKNPFKDLTKFELSLWLTSIIVIIVSFAVSGGDDVLTIIASLIGVTALIFVAKGYVIGQVLTVVFAVFYGIISYFFRYYGEMITYLCMTAPIAVMAVISWIKNPYEGTKEVKVSHVTKKQVLVMATLAIVTTIIFYFILKAMNNANLLFSTISITTSFLASYLTFLRSPYYAVAYSANDVVLIVLWTMATLEDRSYLPMILCFVMFLINDMYGFFNWRRMRIRQENI